MCQAIVLVVLREVKAYLLTIGRDAHGNKAINELIAQPAHGKGVGEDNNNGKQVIEENHESVPCAGDDALPSVASNGGEGTWETNYGCKVKPKTR